MLLISLTLFNYENNSVIKKLNYHHHYAELLRKQQPFRSNEELEQQTPHQLKEIGYFIIMKQNIQYLRLQENLLYLNLKQMHLHLDNILDSNVSLLEGLLKLTDYEIEIKRENVLNAMVKIAHFPHYKTLKDF